MNWHFCYQKTILSKLQKNIIVLLLLFLFLIKTVLSFTLLTHEEIFQRVMRIFFIIFSLLNIKKSVLFIFKLLILNSFKLTDLASFLLVILNIFRLKAVFDCFFKIFRKK